MIIKKGRKTTTTTTKKKNRKANVESIDLQCEQFTLQLSYANAFVFQHRSLGVLPHDQSRSIRSTNDQEAPRDMLKKHICTLQLTADHRMWDFVYSKNDKVFSFCFQAYVYTVLVLANFSRVDFFRLPFCFSRKTGKYENGNVASS